MPPPPSPSPRREHRPATLLFSPAGSGSGAPRPSAGRRPRCRGAAGSGGQLPPRGARRNGKFVRSRASASRSRPKLPRSARAGAGPRPGCTHSPGTPGEAGADSEGDRGNCGDRLISRMGQSGVLREGVALGVSRTLCPRREDAWGPDSESSRRATAVLASGFLDVPKPSRQLNVAGRIEFSETWGERFRRPAPARWSTCLILPTPGSNFTSAPG